MNSQTSPADTGSNIIRSFLSFFDKPAYWLLTIIYQLFFNVASADLFAGDTIMKFFGRVQLILGVFMMFQLAMTILKGIVNPDSFMDSKSGAYNLVYRIAVALIMLTLLVPFRTAGSNQLEVQISNNGILFGTLYDLQHRLLENNTIGRLILGSNDTSGYFSSNSGDAKTEEEQLAKSARVFSSTILKGFYRINLLPEDQWPPGNDYEENDPAIFNDVRVCSDIDDAVLETYTKEDANPLDIIDMVNLTCNRNYQTILSGNNYYIFAYTGFVSMIVGFLFVAILLSFTVDIAVRSVKLAVLRLIAPIPIISYMDPKGSKDSAFNSWVKTLTSTYIDIFIRLAVVYFVIFLIQDMIDKGVVIKHGTGTLGIISWIILWVGLFVFAKQSPAFIKKVLGMKDEGGFGLFSGLDSALGVGALAAGTIGSALSGARASWAADQENHGTASHFIPHNLVKNAISGIAGGVLGAGTGFKAMSDAKGNTASAVMSAMNSRNAKVLSAGRSGGTLLGGVSSSARSLLTGESPYDVLERQYKKDEQAIKDAEAELKPLKDVNALRKTMMDRAASKAVDSEYTSGSYGGITGNYRDYHSAYVAAKSGAGVTHDASGDWFEFNGQRVDMARADSIDIGLRDANANDYYEQAISGTLHGGDTTITDARDALLAQSITVQSSLGGSNGLKATYGAANTEINNRSADINRQSEALNKNRTGHRARRAESNANRFGGGGGKSGG